MATFLEHFIKTISNDLILTDKTTRTIRPNPGYLTLNELWNPGLGATAWVNVGNALGTLSAAPVETRTDSLGNTISNKIGTTDSNRVRFITNNTVYGILSTSGVLNLGDQTTIDATSPGANDKLRITSGVLSLKEWVAPPGAPPANSAASGYSKLYPRADGSLYYYNDSLEEFKISPDAGTILTNTDGTGISPRVALWSDSSSPYNSLKGDAELTFSTNVLTVGASSTGRITVNNTANSSPSILINNTSSTAIKTGLQTNISNATTTGVGIYSVIAGSGASTNVLFDGAYTSSGSVNYGVLISGEDYNQLSGWLSIGGSHLPETTLHITGASVTTQATNYVAIQKSEVVFSKNTINPRNFKVTHIVPEFNFGGLNESTNVDILTIDTVNTNVTGLDTLNLIKASYGGIEKFSVFGNGNTTFAGDLIVSGSGSSDFTGNLILRGQSPATGYVLTSRDNNGSTTWTDPATVAQTLISGTPAANQITYFDSPTTITGNSNFIYDGNIVFINNTSNSKMTQGITINQNGNDNEILALQSTDVAHGITTYADTSTYASFSKFDAAAGGIQINGFSETAIGIGIYSFSTLTDDLKSIAGQASLNINVSLKDGGTGVTSFGATNNIIAIQNNLDTILIIDGNGDIIPATTDSASLGTDDNRFSDLYLGPASIKMGTGGGSPNEVTFSWDTASELLTIKHTSGVTNSLKMRLGDDTILADQNIANSLFVFGNTDSNKGIIRFGNNTSTSAKIEGNNSGDLKLNANVSLEQDFKIKSDTSVINIVSLVAVTINVTNKSVILVDASAVVLGTIDTLTDSNLTQYCGKIVTIVNVGAATNIQLASGAGNIATTQDISPGEALQLIYTFNNKWHIISKT